MKFRWVNMQSPLDTISQLRRNDRAYVRPGYRVPILLVEDKNDATMTAIKCKRKRNDAIGDHNIYVLCRRGEDNELYEAGEVYEETNRLKMTIDMDIVSTYSLLSERVYIAMDECSARGEGVPKNKIALCRVMFMVE